MTASDWKNLLLGVGSILDIDPAPLPPLADDFARLRAKREARAKRSGTFPALAGGTPTPAPTADELAGRVAAETAEGVAEFVARHPLRDRIQRVGPLKFIVYRAAPLPAGRPAGG